MSVRTIAPDENNDISLAYGTRTPIFTEWSNPTWSGSGTSHIISYSISFNEQTGKWNQELIYGQPSTPAYTSVGTVSQDLTTLTFNYTIPYIMTCVYTRTIIPVPIDNEISFNSGVQAYADILKAAILTQTGELQLDPDRGIPYFETVFENPRYLSLWAAYIERTVKSFPWVVRIEDFVYNFVSEEQGPGGVIQRVNELRYTLKVLTDQGTATVRSNDR